MALTCAAPTLGREGKAKQSSTRTIFSTRLACLSIRIEHASLNVAQYADKLYGLFRPGAEKPVSGGPASDASEAAHVGEDKPADVSSDQDDGTASDDEDDLDLDIDKALAREISELKETAKPSQRRFNVRSYAVHTHNVPHSAFSSAEC